MFVSRARVGVVVGAALVVSAVVGFGISALGGEGAEGEAPPGLPYVIDAASPAGDGSGALITTDGASFDPTILTKFIPGTGFAARKGTGIEDDRTDHIFGGTCVYPATGSGGTLTEYRAGVELPDGARITRVVFFGEDNDAVRNILIRLNRTTVTPSVGVTTRSDDTVASFTTSGFAGVAAVTSPDLTELTGSVSAAPPAEVGHRFHTLYVELSNLAGFLHKLCGVEVEYQVPVSGADPGTVFHPIDPVRAFDSRISSYARSGILTRNTSRVISIKNGHDLAGVLTAPNVIPAGATAIAYNITSTESVGLNHVAVTAGNAATFNAAALNFNGAPGAIANAAIVSIDPQRRIKIWGGTGAGSTHVVIDITGYFAPPTDSPNMGN